MDRVLVARGSKHKYYFNQTTTSFCNTTVLAMVDQLEAEDEAAQKQFVLAIAHSEDVTRWATAISEWLQTALLPVSIAELSGGLKMPWVEVWLGVLFGGFQLEQWGEFYESPVWVRCPNDQAMTLKRNG